MAPGQVLPALLTSLLLILSFPRPDQGWLALLALVPLLWVCRRTTPKRAFFLGWLSGAAWLFVSLSWLTVTMTRYGGIPAAVSYLLILALAAFHGSIVGAFAAFVPSTQRLGRAAQVVVLASLWAACELARSWIPAPFPWLLLGSAFWKYPPALLACSAVGVYGLSWAAAAVNALLLGMVSDIATGGYRKVLPSVAVLAAVGAGLSFPLLVRDAAQPPTLRVAVIQGNFEQEDKWDERIQNQTMDVYLDLSRQAAGRGAELILWPETAVPFFFQSEKDLAKRVVDFVEESRVHLVFGSPAYDVEGDRVILFNSAYHLAPGHGPERYDKVRLVPFGEYVPFKWALPFVSKMVQSIGEFRPGRWERPFETPVPAGTLICYEVAMPGLARREANDGARILVNLTNDAWFGESWGPYQHLALAAVRAAENGMPVARAANTGVSAVIDRRGRMIGSLGLFTRGMLVADVGTGGPGTIYRRVGDMIVYFSGVVVIIHVWASWKRKRGSPKSKVQSPKSKVQSPKKETRS